MKTQTYSWGSFILTAHQLPWKTSAECAAAESDHPNNCHPQEMSQYTRQMEFLNSKQDCEMCSRCNHPNVWDETMIQFQNQLSCTITWTALKDFHLSRSCNNPMLLASCLTHVSIWACCALPYLLFRKREIERKKNRSTCLSK